MPIDISNIENSQQSTINGDHMQVSNVVAKLAGEILKAHFGEALQFAAPGTMALKAPGIAGARGEFEVNSKNVNINPDAHRNAQTMYLKKDVTGPGYTGNFDANPTTHNVLNMVQTMLHEITHSRVTQAKNSPLYSDELKSMMPTTLNSRQKEVKVAQIIDSLGRAALPSMGVGSNLNEFLATAIPLQMMKQKIGALTPAQEEMQAEVASLVGLYPELGRLIQSWERPELRSLKR